MVSEEICIFALALGISGFIAYKTFQWVFYEEIGTGSAALFLGFSVAVFFVVTNHDFGKRMIRERERSGVKEETLERMSEELRQQREATRLLAESVREASERASRLAVEADRNGRIALETAKTSHERSEEIVAVTAWATWEILMGEFAEIENYLKRWEEKNGLRRGYDTASSMADLAEKMDRLGNALPEPIRTLYLDRHRKYEILKRIKESSESTASRHTGAGLELPAPPTLPATMN